jgi:hypothetical protein
LADISDGTKTNKTKTAGNKFSSFSKFNGKILIKFLFLFVPCCLSIIFEIKKDIENFREFVLMEKFL